MSALSNATQHHQPAGMTSSSPADSALSTIASMVVNIRGWTLFLATLIAIVIYDQGTDDTHV
jgi:hypothetical protein